MNNIIAKILSGVSGKPLAAEQSTPASVTPAFLKQFFAAWVRNNSSQPGRSANVFSSSVRKTGLKNAGTNSQVRVGHLAINQAARNNMNPKILPVPTLTGMQSGKAVVSGQSGKGQLFGVKPDREAKTVNQNCKVKQTASGLKKGKKSLPGAGEIAHADVGAQVVGISKIISSDKAPISKTSDKIRATDIILPRVIKTRSPIMRTKPVSITMPSVKEKQARQTGQLTPSEPKINDKVGHGKKQQISFGQAGSGKQLNTLSGNKVLDGSTQLRNSLPFGTNRIAPEEPSLTGKSNIGNSLLSADDQPQATKNPVKTGEHTGSSKDTNQTLPDEKLTGENIKGNVGSKSEISRPVRKENGLRPLQSAVPGSKDKISGKSVDLNVTFKTASDVNGKKASIVPEKNSRRIAKGNEAGSSTNMSQPLDNVVDSRSDKLGTDTAHSRIESIPGSESIADPANSQPVQARAALAPNQVSLPRLVQQITQTIIDSASGTTTQTNFRINGGNLGTLQIQFQNKAGQSQATIFVESESTRLTVQKVIVDINEGLIQKGISLTSLDVQVSPQSRKHGNPAGRATRGNKRNTIDEESLSNDDTPEVRSDHRDYGYNTIEVLA